MESISSRKNPKVQEIDRLMTSSRVRREEGRFVCEGLRLCLDAAASGATIFEVLMTEAFRDRHPDAAHLLAGAAETVLIISEAVADKLTDTKAPQGVFAVCKMLDNLSLDSTIKGNRPVLGCERIQDPGNLGTMLRTAAALGFGGAVLIGEGADPFSPKALRASMGAVLRLPLVRVDRIGSLFDCCEEGEIPTLAALPQGGEAITRMRGPRGVLLIGNEGNGLSPEAIEGASHRVTIPMAPGAESLNATAAATILMWEMMRDREG